MDSIPSFAAYEPSSEQLSRIAAQLVAEATASPHAVAPPVPAAPHTIPDPLPAAATSASSMGAMPIAPATSATQPFALPTQPFTPSIQPFATPTASPLRTASAPLDDFSGLKSFVARIRGSDAFATQSPRFDAPAPAGVAGFGFFDVDAVRRDFPVLHQRVNGKPLAWFDNAATTQKPQHVIDEISHFYAHDNSNIHRGAHTLAARSTDAYEHARRTVQTFLGASSPDEIIFVRGTTEGINLVAQACGSLLSAGRPRKGLK
jgi:cysteine desulfurase/selenocysteine lyase